MPPAKPGPREFGEALRRAREEAGVSLESVAERTKISRRVLQAFETGAFEQLPSGAFPRLFLRQFVELLGLEPGPWTQAFEAARGVHEGERRPAEVIPVETVKRARMGPWLWGLVLVAGALVTVVLVERHQDARTAAAAATPVAILDVVAPTPAATATPTPAIEAGSNPNTLVIRAGQRSCWVQARVGDEAPASRLLAAGTRWEIPAGGREVNLTLGDGGSVELEYLGVRHTQPGRDGEVVHLRLTPTPPLAPES
ncbi:MAG: RodZ domain-containing protein [Acidobacteriota bacterium]